MVSQMAIMIDETNSVTRRRPLPVHLTCGACGGHHALAFTRSSAPADTSPTHQCRECGFQWNPSD